MTHSLVWHDTAWWLERTTPAFHDVHVSTVDARLIAYYPTEAKRDAGVATRLKPGRYLTTHFAGVLTAKQIAYFAAWQSSGKAPVATDDTTPAVQFATTPNEIENVYLAGPASCMSYAANRYDSVEHPVRVYGAGDLAIAYLTDPDDSAVVISRTLCWPERKVFGRLYPSESVDRQDELKAALMALGYQPHQIASQGFDGARMLRIEHENRDNIFIMPYLDCPANGFDDNGADLILRAGHSYEFTGSNTNGLNSDPEPEYDWHCENCEEGQFDGNGGYSVHTRVSGGRPRGEQSWCDSCGRLRSFRCEGFDVDFADDDMRQVDVNGSTYSEAYALENFTHSDYSDEWFEGEAVEVDGETWSMEEFQEYGFTCAIDGENYANSDMHKDHPGVHKDADTDALAEYVEGARITAEPNHSGTHRPTPTIPDYRQTEINLPLRRAA